MPQIAFPWPDDLWVRRAIVLLSAVVYWVGVAVQARRVRKRIGRSPNVRPRGTKEQLLWLGWFLVVVGWMAMPWLARPDATGAWRLMGWGTHPASLGCGTGLVALGYLGTLWCYAAMGTAWRMGVNRGEQTPLITDGPFRWVRHPIYLLQLIMLAGVACLLPTALSIGLLVLHLGCLWVKATDEEAHLQVLHGEAYRAYCQRTGMLFPKWPA